MSLTPLVRGIVTVNYQPTLLHVCVLLGARVPSVLLSRPNASVAVVGNWHT